LIKLRTRRSISFVGPSCRRHNETIVSTFFIDLSQREPRRRHQP